MKTLNHNPFYMKKLYLRIIILSGIFLALAPACGNSDKDADAYGNFEADEVIVSAQSQGTLTFLNVNEGAVLEPGQLVGKIDTISISIKMDQLAAQHTVIAARLRNLEAQIRVQDEQRVNLVREVDRIEKLKQEEAATAQQYDEIVGRLKVHDMQTEALRSQKNIITGERSVLMAQIDDVKNLQEKCRIVNPIKGVVLEKYVEANELVSPGKALYKIANMGKMELKVYVSGEQLPSIAIGDSADVMIDSTGGNLHKIPGIVSWISSQVEFTPKIIQTREERVNMVYAVRVSVNNDGRLKIGMPGEVIFRNKNQVSVK
jgi:HlyD family secretion protein